LLYEERPRFVGASKTRNLSMNLMGNLGKTHMEA